MVHGSLGRLAGRAFEREENAVITSRSNGLRQKKMSCIGDQGGNHAATFPGGECE